jgi:hypothetical protein
MAPRTRKSLNQPTFHQFVSLTTYERLPPGYHWNVEAEPKALLSSPRIEPAMNRRSPNENSCCPKKPIVTSLLNSSSTANSELVEAQEVVLMT